MKPPGNQHDLRESWLRAAVNLLRPYFVDIGYPLPDHIRTAIAFPSTGRKGKRLGECWHSTSSEDRASRFSSALIFPNLWMCSAC